MQFYLAPMQGITGFIYRNVHHKYYDGVDKYYSPFVVTNMKAHRRNKELHDVLPERNLNVPLIPQLLSSNAKELVVYADFLYENGYKEVNLNCGCPSNMVAGKGRGAGMLADLNRLEAFLDEVFAAGPKPQISIKTRLGMNDALDFPEILEIYNKYPLTELIVHARTRKDMYRPGTVDREAFKAAAGNSRCPVCYNGDLFSKEDIDAFAGEFPMVGAVMCGRGLLERPWLASEYKGGEGYEPERLKAFHEELYEEYLIDCPDKRSAVMQMKEMWCYLRKTFPERSDITSKILRSRTPEEFEENSKRFFE